MAFPKGNKFPRFTGKKHTAESNKKRSETMKKLYREGNSVSMGFKKGSVAWSKGETKETDERLLKKSIEQKGKAPWNKGLGGTDAVKLSEKTLAKIRANSKNGKDSPAWRGGITYIGTVLRTSRKYKNFRASIFEKDNYTCQMCGQVGGKLNCHHIKSFAYFLNKYNLRTKIDLCACTELWDKKNSITLCVNCHKKTDNYLSGNHYSKIQKKLAEEKINRPIKMYLDRLKFFTIKQSIKIFIGNKI